jgi:hypothetical protein
LKKTLAAIFANLKNRKTTLLPVIVPEARKRPSQGGEYRPHGVCCVALVTMAMMVAMLEAKGVFWAIAFSYFPADSVVLTWCVMLGRDGLLWGKVHVAL